MYYRSTDNLGRHLDSLRPGIWEFGKFVKIHSRFHFDSWLNLRPALTYRHLDHRCHWFVRPIGSMMVLRSIVVAEHSIVAGEHSIAVAGHSIVVEERRAIAVGLLVESMRPEQFRATRNYHKWGNLGTMLDWRQLGNGQHLVVRLMCSQRPQQQRQRSIKKKSANSRIWVFFSFHTTIVCTFDHKIARNKCYRRTNWFAYRLHWSLYVSIYSFFLLFVLTTFEIIFNGFDIYLFCFEQRRIGANKKLYIFFFYGKQQHKTTDSIDCWPAHTDFRSLNVVAFIMIPHPSPSCNFSYSYN